MSVKSLLSICLCVSAVFFSAVTPEAHGADRVPLSSLRHRYGLTMEEDVTTGRLRLYSSGLTLILLPNIAKALVDGKIVYLSGTLQYQQGEVFLPSDILRHLPVVHDEVPERRSENHEFTVVLDAGHGGRDPGAPGFDGVHEKMVVLSVAKKVGAALGDQKHIRVVYTRRTDRYISLEERPRIADRVGADLFVSIHANAAKSRRASGIETFYISTAVPDSKRAKTMGEQYNIKQRFPGEVASLSRFQERELYEVMNHHNRIESKRIAYLVQKRLVGKVRALNRKHKEANFRVLRLASCPAVLIELGFLSNPVESRKLAKNAYQDRLAETIAKTIVDASIVE